MEDKTAINKARALYYALFGTLFAFVESEKRFDTLAEKIKLLKNGALDEDSQKALENMQNILESKGLKFVEDEYDALFYDLSGDPVPTTASFYEEERDDGKKRLLMVNYVLRSKYRRDKEKFTDLEDDIGFIFTFINHLILDEIDGNKNSAELEKEVFQNILNGFVDDFIENIYMHENSAFYQEVAVLLKVFIEFERVYLGVQKPQERVVRKKSDHKNISDIEAARRLANKKKKGEQIIECNLEEGGDVEDEI